MLTGYTMQVTGLLAVLSIHAGLLGWSAALHSPVLDEVGHLAAGLGHWRFQRFDLFAVNPPLVRSIAVIPLVFGGYHEDWSEYQVSIRARPELALGRAFIAANPDSFLQAFVMARWMCIPFSLLGATVCHYWSKERYGEAASWVALLLWCFSPTLLGHAALMTPDASAAALGVATCYAFRHWMLRPNWTKSFLAGLLLGLAELTKFTWIALFAVLPLIWLMVRLRSRTDVTRSWTRESIQVAFMLVFAVYTINLAYTFEGTLTRFGDFQFSSRALSGRPEGVPSRWQGNRFRDTWIGDLPVPVPKNMLLGIDQVKYEYELGYWSYLRGEHRQGGWWHYYVYAMLVKMPLGTWCLLLAALALYICRLTKPSPSRVEFPVLIPAIVVVGLVSSQTGFNHHLRYVLPAFPFLFIFASSAAELAQSPWKAIRVVPLVGIVGAMTSSLFTFPHSLSYFNEAIGGPQNGRQHLLFSNVDWGQDLVAVSKWHRDRQEAKPLYVAATTFLEPVQLGMDATYPRPFLRDARDSQSPVVVFPPGWYVLGIDTIWRKNSDLAIFQRLVPTDRIGYSTLVFHVAEPLEAKWPRIAHLRIAAPEKPVRMDRKGSL